MRTFHPFRRSASSRTASAIASVSGFLDSAWFVAADVCLPQHLGGRLRLRRAQALVLATLKDCAGAELLRLRCRAQVATSLEGLRRQRERLYDGIARMKSESEAAAFLARFDALVPPAAPAHRRRHHV